MPSEFSGRVLEAVSRIREGHVCTYGMIAAAAGAPRAARAVGTVLHHNPQPGVIPCHRVVNREGRLSGSFAFGGRDVQQQMLELEGVEVRGGRVDLERYLDGDILRPRTD